MKIISTVVSSLAIVSCAGATSLQIESLSREQRAAIAASAQESGMHCPVVIGLAKISESERGWIVRVTCRSTDGKSTWPIRLSGLPSWQPQFSSFDDPVPPNRDIDLRALKRP
jgi:hypothetical protein